MSTVTSLEHGYVNLIFLSRLLTAKKSNIPHFEVTLLHCLNPVFNAIHGEDNVSPLFIDMSWLSSGVGNRKQNYVIMKVC